MLLQIRNGITNKIAKPMLAIVIVSFIFWGFGDVIRGSNDNVVARIGEKVVNADEFQKHLKQEVSRLQAQNEGLTYEKLKASGIDQVVLNNLVNAKLLELYINDLGLNISEEKVKALIHSNPAFKNENGKFDLKTFKSALTHNNYSEIEFKKIAKKEALLETLFASVFAVKPAPEILVAQLFKFNSEKRTVALYSMKANIDLALAEPSDADLKKHFKENIELFKNAEKRDFQIIEIDSDAITANTSVSKAELQKFYNDNIENFGQPESRDVYNFVFATEQEASNFYNDLEKASDIDSFLAEKTLVKDNVLLKKVSKKDFSDELSNFIFTAKADQVSKPIKTVMGYHVMKLAQIYESNVKSFDSIAKALEKEAIAEKTQRHLAELNQKLQDEISSGQTIEEIAKNNNYKITQYNQVSQNRWDSKNNKKVNIEPYIMDEIFNLYEDSDPEIIPTADGNGITIAKLTLITPESFPEFDEARKFVYIHFKDTERTKALLDRATTFAEQAKTSKNIDVAASALGFKFERNAEITRSGELKEKLDGNDLPQGVIANSFHIDLKQYTNAFQSVSGTYYVARVDNIEIPTAEKDPSGIKMIRADLKNAYSSELIDQLFLHLRSKYKVEINNSLISELD